MTLRPWTDAEIETLRERYPDRSTPLVEIARDFGRSVMSLRQQARRLGLVRPSRWSPPAAAPEPTRYGPWSADEIELLRVRWPQRANTSAVPQLALALGRTQVSVRWKAESLGLPKLQTPERARRGLALRRAALLRNHGASHLGQVALKREAAFAGEYGLPADLRPRQVQMLVALVLGPATPREVRAQIGLSDNKKATHAGGYVRDLIARGLVERLPPSGPHQPPTLMLSAVAMEMLASAPQQEKA